MSKVVVIGCGAAGFLAAITAARMGAEVTVLERMNQPGRKLMITGKGRCNITNSCSMDEMIAHIPGNGKFLYGAFSQFSNQDIIRLLEDNGLPTKVERGGRVFPVSDKAPDVVKTLEKILTEAHGRLLTNCRASHFDTKDGLITAVVDTEGNRYPGDAFIITTGGASYPRTGSTGDGYTLAKSVGHTIVTPSPALAPLECEMDDPKVLQGLSLRNVSVSLLAGDKVLAEEFGEMLFTHFGVSGPVILKLSRTAALYWKKHPDGLLDLAIDLKPALTPEQLDVRLQRDFQKYSRKQLKAGMHDLLPQSLIPVIIDAACLKPDQPVNQLTKKERLRLAATLKKFTLPLTGTRPLAEAIVTAGGVNLKEISPSTFASKLVPNLFFAGEVMDVDGFTGGYNLQAAFSSGFVSGKNAAAFRKEEL
ncbi:MAG: NAD(P)/FAD-dependent oxidoreductase [Acidaminococcus sp.]|jgi:predicted Rossmann fold flavoprotein|nr:NAD(P)/FAD-dependent oxidoreductase [Acidaminococcus sp.]MCI2099464.1 NAD(P)/FAD-dependent oxidoreductase [Acidaminococcus sp.]MCI2113824.1 NAD(P)/FAD-dependent oxidoreductase [Acidaminococcus sp.]MCI2115602.1 NAD(P)/FAD-dependent oxidoreductase [Acidaminococcus sp.]